MKRLAFAVVLLVGAAASAQNPERQFPTPHHQKLDALVGEWAVDVRYKAGEGFRDGTATCTSKWELDGMTLSQKYVSKMGDRTLNVVQMLGYDVGKKKAFEIFMDNMAPAVMYNEGDFSADGATLTHQGTRHDPQTGQAKKIRTVYTMTDADHYTLEWLEGDGDKAEKVVTLKHTRKKK